MWPRLFIFAASILILFACEQSLTEASQLKYRPINLLRHERFMATSWEAGWKCDAMCSAEIDCRAYTYIAKGHSRPPPVSQNFEGMTDYKDKRGHFKALGERTDVPFDEDKSLLHDCYLESRAFDKVRTHIDHRVLSVEGSFHVPDIELGISHLLRGPQITTGDTLLHVPAHFTRGCAYTVSMWVWLWEPQVPNSHEIPLLTARSTETGSGEDEAPISGNNQYEDSKIWKRGVRGEGTGYGEREEGLHPSIVFNVGSESQKKNFFFAGARDPGGNIHGFWASPRDGKSPTVQYNKWIHLALSIEESPAVGGSVLGGGLVKGYVNGEAVGSVIMEVPRQSKGQGSRDPHGFMQCTYNMATPGNGGIRTKLAGTTVTSSQSQHGRAHLKHPAINNTVLQIMGTSGGGIIGTPGMVQDLMVISNKVLPDASIRDLAKLRPPVPLPTLERLLVTYGILGRVGDVCVLDLGGGQAAASTPTLVFANEMEQMQHNRQKEQDSHKLLQYLAQPRKGAGHDYFSYYFWRAKSWGICAPNVCGPMSLNPHFLLSLKSGTPYKMRDPCYHTADGTGECLYTLPDGTTMIITPAQYAAVSGLRVNEVQFAQEGGLGYHTSAQHSRIEPRQYGMQRAAYNFHTALPDDSTGANANLGVASEVKHTILGAGSYVAATVTWLVEQARFYFAFYVQQMHAIIDDVHSVLGYPQEAKRERTQAELDELKAAGEESQRISDDEDDGQDEIDAIEAELAAQRNPRKTHEHIVMDLYDSAMLWLHGNAHVRQEKKPGSPLFSLHAMDDQWDDDLVKESYPFRAVLARSQEREKDTCTAGTGKETCAGASVIEFNEDTASAGPTARIPHPKPSQLVPPSLLRQRRNTYEKAFSALALAAWIAHDNQAKHPAGPHTHWSHRYAPPMAQPLHMALAHKLWWDPAEATTVQLPSDLGAYLKDSLKLGLEVMDLVHGGNSSAEAAEQRHHIKSKAWPRFYPVVIKNSPYPRVNYPEGGWESLIPGNRDEDMNPASGAAADAGSYPSGQDPEDAGEDTAAAAGEHFNKVYDEAHEELEREKEIETLEANLPPPPKKPRQFGATNMEEAQGQMIAQQKYEEAVHARQASVDFISAVKKEHASEKEASDARRKQHAAAAAQPATPEGAATDFAQQAADIAERRKLGKNWFDVFASLEGRAYSTATYAGSAAEASGVLGARISSAALIPELAPLQGAGLHPGALPALSTRTKANADKKGKGSLESYLETRDGQSIPVDASVSGPMSSVFSANTAFYKNMYKLMNEEDTFQTPLAQTRVNDALSQVGQCRAAAAHLFPVASYVTSHYGQVGTGVAAMEDIRIASSDLDQQAGTDTDTHHFYVSEAQDGDENAMLYLARRYFWGQGGVRADPERARHWFEQAAERNNAEGLYNVGVLHSSGQIGYNANQTAAMDYFNRSAHPVRADQAPFPMALHALGGHYQNQGRAYWKTAKDYYTRAARAGSTDGHFALASMMQSGQGGKVDVPGAVRHAVIAANAGHARSKYFLAHALYDPESWLYAWGRQQTWTNQEKDRDYYAYGRPHHLVESTFGTKGYGLRGTPEEKAQQIKENKEFFEEIHRKAKINNEAKEAKRQRIAAEAASDSEAYDSWVYDEGTPFVLHLPTGDIEVPMPLGQTDGCLTALYLMQSISHMSGRTNDLVDAALVAYMEGEFYESLELYNEAAELGVPAAQENSAVLMEFMAPIECAGVGDMLGTNYNQSHFGPLSWKYETLEEQAAADLPVDGLEDTANQEERWVPLRDLGLDASVAQGEGDLLDLEVEVSTYKALVEQHKCTGYFERLAYKRFTQLANSGDAGAKNDLAHLSLKKPDLTEEDVKYAASMLVYASEQGDISSLMDLGWLFYRPDVRFQNESTSRAIFSAIGDWEKKLRAGNAYTTDSTSGAASYLALLYCDVDAYVKKAGFVSIAAMYNAFLYVAEGILNDVLSIFRDLSAFGSTRELEAELERIAYNAKSARKNTSQSKYISDMYPPSFVWLMSQYGLTWNEGVKFGDFVNETGVDAPPEGHPEHYKEHYEGLMWVHYYLTKMYRTAPELFVSVALMLCLGCVSIAYYQQVVYEQHEIRLAEEQREREAERAAAAAAEAAAREGAAAAARPPRA